MDKRTLTVAARESPLSQAQVKELLNEIREYYPDIEFQVRLTASYGDRDKSVSLRTLDKTDFFTREVDALVLNHTCRIAVHSAKDLPEPIPEGIEMAALTRGQDPSDSLVMRDGEALKAGMCIATSSERREEAVKKLCADVRFVDIRGTIGERLEKLKGGEVDGVVIAEAALIRLNLHHLNRIRLPGSTTPLQGQLAVMARAGDDEMRNIFACIDVRKKRKKLYLGLNAPKPGKNEEITHFPIIRIAPRSFDDLSIQKAFKEMPALTHLIFTSQSSVNIFMDAIKHFKLDFPLIQKKVFFAVGKETAKALQRYNIIVSGIAQNETAEGLAALLREALPKDAYLFWPHSALARPVLIDFFKENRTAFVDCVLYDTVPFQPGPLPNTDLFSEIVFTSPSTVDAFLELFKAFPSGAKLTAIGPITQAYIVKK